MGSADSSIVNKSNASSGKGKKKKKKSGSGGGTDMNISIETLQKALVFHPILTLLICLDLHHTNLLTLTLPYSYPTLPHSLQDNGGKGLTADERKKLKKKLKKKKQQVRKKNETKKNRRGG